LRPFRAHVALLLVPVFAGSAWAQQGTAGANAQQSLPHLVLSISAVVDGKSASGSWTIPALRRQDTSDKCLFVRTLNPAMKLPCDIKEDASRVLATPFGTAFLRLDGGAGFAVDLEAINLETERNGRATPGVVTRDHAPFYFLDSIDAARTLTDYWQASQNARCASPVEGCRIVSSIAIASQGPLKLTPGIGATGLLPVRADGLRQLGIVRPPAQIFLNQGVSVYQSDAIRTDAELHAMLGPGAKRREMATLDVPALRHIRTLTGIHDHTVDLEYLGGNRWSVPKDGQVERSASTELSRPRKFHRATGLAEEHVTCCGKPADRLTSAGLALVSGEIAYGGRVFHFDPSWADKGPAKWPALLDLDGGQIFVLQPLGAKAFWMIADRT
jgi:hypothetical protein